MSCNASRHRLAALSEAFGKKVKTGSAGRTPWSVQKPILVGTHRVQRRLRPTRYTDADPYKLLYVDPDRIEYHVNRTSSPRVFGTVSGGDWDQQREPIAGVDVYESLVQRFRHGAPWEDTELYEALLEEPTGRLWTRACESDEERLSRLREIDELHQAIATEGYLTQRELLGRDAGATQSLNNEACHPVLNEVGVNIGRDGALLWRHRGLHRLSIARILDLERIPVVVLARHREWQRIRDRVRTRVSGLEETVTSHPDLRNLT
ncbi:hypothetical protein CV102_08490 [Natronococcus pandeyae]|uniref:Uncharacterized protein n=2 Tax=Natronococcus pandeyae TaxID=2055836 RepID=A0A8J8Q347_9EURY|nr:hypothetical protein CV102_08490 [Natronococcus pandeyae]